jgi:hypothetical protein
VCGRCNTTLESSHVAGRLIEEHTKNLKVVRYANFHCNFHNLCRFMHFFKIIFYVQANSNKFKIQIDETMVAPLKNKIL